MTLTGENVAPADGVPRQLAAQQDAPCDLVDHRVAAIRVVGDAAPDLAHTLAVRLAAHGQQLWRIQPIGVSPPIVLRL